MRIPNGAFNTIRSRILGLVIILMAATSLTFTFITTRNYRSVNTSQYHHLADESVDSVIRVIDAEYNDLLTYELTAINNQRSLMENLGNSILVMADSFYIQQKAGLLTEQAAKEQCLNQIGRYRYQKDNFFFICDVDLTGMLHPNKQMLGKKWIEFEDIQKREALSLVQKIIKNKKRTFTVFMWPRPEDMKLVKQLGFFLYYPQWEWIIGTAYQIGQIKQQSMKKEERILSKLDQIIGEFNINEVGGIFIFNRSGDVILHTSRLEKLDVSLAGKELVKTIGTLQIRAGNEFKNPVKYEYKDKDQKKHPQTAYIKHYPYLDWNIASFIDDVELEKPGDAIAVRQLILFLGVLAVGIILSVFISKKIAFSLSLLAKYARQIPHHHFNSQKNPVLESIRATADNEETRQLTDAFAFMEAELGKNIEQLDRHRRNLEELVELRTRELTDANLNLQESERNLKAVLSASPVGIGRIVDRKLSWANKTMYKMIGYDQNSLLGQSAQVLYPDEKEYERVGKILYNGLSRSKICQVETCWKRKDGTLFDCIIRITLLDESDPAQGQIVSVIDISEFKQTQLDKIEAQNMAAEQKKMALVGQIAGKMAHDFNNILGIVMGNAQIALMDCQNEGVKKKLELIFNQTLRGKNLTKNLVAFAKDQEIKQKYFKVNTKIDMLLSLMQKELENITIIRDDAPDLPELLADPGMIEHAMVNLLQNSIHAVSMCKNPQIYIKTFYEKEKICIEIKDNGCGIPPKALERIYEPAFTLKGSNDCLGAYKAGVKGTGYGMTNVKKYVEKHQGTISVQSEVGMGTKFKIQLPVIQKKLTVREKRRIQNQTIEKGKRILLVEDESPIADIQHTILTTPPCSHHVSIANDGKAAMDLFESKEFDLISLDYILPGKFNGMDVYEYIRKKNKFIPILFLSGNIEFLESIKHMKKMDSNLDHISKPCPNKDYLDHIHQLMKRCQVAK